MLTTDVRPVSKITLIRALSTGKILLFVMLSVLAVGRCVKRAVCGVSTVCAREDTAYRELIEYEFELLFEVYVFSRCGLIVAKPREREFFS
jgi:hypothetical protein